MKDLVMLVCASCLYSFLFIKFLDWGWRKCDNEVDEGGDNTP